MGPVNARKSLLDATLLALVLVSALALKRRYGAASAEELDWLLAPTTSLVELVTGQHFIHEARIGFVSERLPIIIAPGCAGLNFFVIALLTLSFGFLSKLRTPGAKALWLAASVPLAYAATLFANTVRIASAIALHEGGLRVPMLTAAEAHRALGVVVYLPVAWLLFAVAERFFSTVERSRDLQEGGRAEGFFVWIPGVTR
jgi:exosortase K